MDGRSPDSLRAPRLIYVFLVSLLHSTIIPYQVGIPGDLWDAGHREQRHAAQRLQESYAGTPSLSVGVLRDGAADCYKHEVAPDARVVHEVESPNNLAADRSLSVSFTPEDGRLR